MNPLKKHIALLLFSLTSLSNGVAQTYPIVDDGFRQCLIDRYPSLLDVNDELVITAANNLAGDLYCAGFGINDVDGLQHFTSLDTINFNQNKLNNIDEVALLTNLKTIIVHTNELTSLPDFTNFDKLTDLIANNNFISIPPALPTNSVLVNLDLKENNLTSFPDLSNQINLENLRVSRNSEIKTIPPLPALTSLVYFECYICGLTQVPDISALSALEYFDIGYNDISVLPDFSANTQLNTIYANNNRLTSFADMRSLPSLTKARLYNNFLSYEDFEPLLTDVNYSDIYKIIPQNEFPNPLEAHYYEYDEISLATGIANSASDKLYSWYYNDVLLWQGNLDTLSIPSAKISDSGEYYFTISHPDFPDLTLTSSKQTIIVEECLDAGAFTISTIGATCRKAGAIHILSGPQPQSSLTYILESTSSARIFKNTNGNFGNLNNPEYKLYVKASESCTKFIETITLPIDECKEVFFTPNNDGIDDSFYFQQSGTAKIYDKWGQLVKELAIPADWDGRVNNSVITPGYYTVDINDGEETIRLSVIY